MKKACDIILYTTGFVNGGNMRYFIGLFICFILALSGCAFQPKQPEDIEFSFDLPKSQSDNKIPVKSEETHVSDTEEDRDPYEEYLKNKASEPKKEVHIETTPYAPINFNILDLTVNGYINKTGNTLFEMSSEQIELYLMNQFDDTQYYFTSDISFVAFRYNKIRMLSSSVSNLTDSPSSMMRDVISSLGADELFEIEPAVKTLQNSNVLFYWKTENGYIGFITVGVNDPKHCYANAVISIVFFEDLNIIRIKNDLDINFAPQDYHENPEKYKVYTFENLQYGDDVIIIPQNEVYNFRFFSFDTDIFTQDLLFAESETLYTTETLSSEKPFVTRIHIVGPGGPHHGVSYIDSDGIYHSFIIVQSGKDGTYGLDYLQQSNDIFIRR